MLALCLQTIVSILHTLSQSKLENGQFPEIGPKCPQRGPKHHCDPQTFGGPPPGPKPFPKPYPETFRGFPMVLPQTTTLGVLRGMLGGVLWGMVWEGALGYALGADLWVCYGSMPGDTIWVCFGCICKPCCIPSCHSAYH